MIVTHIPSRAEQSTGVSRGGGKLWAQGKLVGKSGSSCYAGERLSSNKSALFLVQETSLQMEVPFRNVHFLYKGEIYVFYF